MGDMLKTSKEIVLTLNCHLCNGIVPIHTKCPEEKNFFRAISLIAYKRVCPECGASLMQKKRSELQEMGEQVYKTLHGISE